MRKLNNAIDRFCILHPNFGVPRLALYIAVCNIAVFLLSSFSSASASLFNFLAFSPAMLLRGQVWRLVTFVLIPDDTRIFWLLLGCYCTYWIGTTLERQWGTAKFTCYYLCGMLLTVLGAALASLLSGYDVPVYGGSDISFAMFLAFALLWPDAQLILIPIPIPIKAKWLAYFDLALFALNILSPILGGVWRYAAKPLAALVNVCVFTWPELCGFLKLERRRSKQAAHFHNTTANARRQARQPNAGERKCAVCGRTNLTNPDLQFRYCSQCAGYHCFCSDHIFSHVHFTEEKP